MRAETRFAKGCSTCATKSIGFLNYLMLTTTNYMLLMIRAGFHWRNLIAILSTYSTFCSNKKFFKFSIKTCHFSFKSHILVKCRPAKDSLLPPWPCQDCFIQRLKQWSKSRAGWTKGASVNHGVKHRSVKELASFNRHGSFLLELAFTRGSRTDLGQLINANDLFFYIKY